MGFDQIECGLGQRRARRLDGQHRLLETPACSPRWPVLPSPEISPSPFGAGEQPLAAPWWGKLRYEGSIPMSDYPTLIRKGMYELGQPIT